MQVDKNCPNMSRHETITRHSGSSKATQIQDFSGAMPWIMILTRPASSLPARLATDRYQHVDILRLIAISLVNMRLIPLSGFVAHPHHPPRGSSFGESRPMFEQNDNVDIFVDMAGTLGDVTVVLERA
jgi:hypothetical protein